MIDISFCRRDEIPALVEFLRQDWKPDHIFVRDPEFLAWHYDARRCRAVPEGGLSVLLARDGDRIVGMLGLNETGFGVFGEPGRAVWASLWYAKPEYRRQAIGARLWQPVLKAGYTAICMIGMHPSVRSFFQSLGCELLIDTPRWCRVLDAAAALRFLADNEQADAKAVRTLVETLTKAAETTTGRERCRDLELADWDDASGEAWDRAWYERFAPTLVGTDKSAEYLSWRYVRHPIFDYRVRVARSEGLASELEALLVTRLELPRGCSAPILRIVELLGAPAALTALAADELARASERGALFADFHAASARFAQPLEALGFRELEPEAEGALVPHRFQPVQFGRIPLTSGYRLDHGRRMRVPELLGCPDFHVSRADGDQDRPN